MSPISSRNSEPPSACSKRPRRRLSAPVNAPFSWPNSSDSSSSAGIAEVLSAMNGLLARGLCSCSARAASSLPVPDSPVISTFTLERDRRPMARNTCCIAGARPSSSGIVGVGDDAVDAADAGRGGALDQVDRLVDVERLGQVLEGAALIGRHGTAEIGVRRHHDDRQFGMGVVHPPQQIETRLPGHADVGDQHVGCVVAQRGQRRLGGIERLRHHAAVLQRALQYPADGGVVIDQPDTQRLGIHSAPSSGSSREKTVCPGRLSNSTMPRWRVTRSCATASPRPVPFGRLVTSG